MTKVNAVTTYQEALSQLTDAVNALDQAHSMMRDLGLESYITTKLWGRYVNLSDAVNVADGLLRDMQNITCPDCQKPMADSEDCLIGCCPEVR